MAKFLLRYKVHFLGLGILALGLGLTSWWATPSEATKKSVSRVYAVDTTYYKERLKILTNGSRYGSNAAVCQQALTAYYERKTEAEAKKGLQIIQTQCRLSKQSSSQTR